MGLTELVDGILSIGIFARLLEFVKLLLISAKTLRRDLVFVTRGLRFIVTLRLWQFRNLSVGHFVEMNAQQDPHKVCFYFEDRYLTFKQVNELSNQIAHYFAGKGFKKGDSVALVMSNRPEYPCVWIGLSKLGVATALVNFNLRLESLQHCIKAANAKAVIYEKELASAIKDVVDLGELKNVTYHCFDGSTPEIANSENLSDKVKEMRTRDPDSSKSIGFHDNLCYVYTSGTTGLPKAAVIKHHRFFLVGVGTYIVYGMKADDVFLTPLPLYHMAGGALAISQAVLFRCSVVITRKFSASKFWSDCIRYNVTVSQYLGEICRFLMSQPPKPEDISHNVRLMIGTGLRAEIWDEFIERFRVPQMLEFYGATEGNCSMANIWNKKGAVGHFPRILLPFYPMAIVKVDPVTGEPIRDPKTGLTIKCKPNEVGEVVAAIRATPLRDFPGYMDKKATSNKIIHNVFSKGDIAFRSGDVMVMDDYGYFYFRDRVGDTFRWKGENVSTMEVELTLSRLCGLNDVAVYGVEVPGTEGRAGMAAVSDPDHTLDLDKLIAGALKSLPIYAVPCFLRILNRNVELTGTYKLRKGDLQKEAFDLSNINDKMYVLVNGKYVPLTEDLYDKIKQGKLRL